MTDDRPLQLHLTWHHRVRWMLVPAVGIIVVGVIGIGVYLVGYAEDDDEADWSLTLGGPLLLAAIPFVMWILFSLWLRSRERHHANRVLDDAVVAWPQYSTPAQWAKDLDELVERHRADWAQIVGPTAVFTVAIVIITTFAAFGGDTVNAIVVGGLTVVAVWLIAGVAIVVRYRVAGSTMERARSRLASIEPYPRCWVSLEGAYHEESGVVRFNRLSEVEFVEPADLAAHKRRLKEAGISIGQETDLTPLDTRLATSGWGHLALTLESTAAHTAWAKFERAFSRTDRTIYWVQTIHVRVPPDDVLLGHDLAFRIGRRWPGTNAALPAGHDG